MKDLNYYLIPVYILLAFVLGLSLIYCNSENKIESETALKMAEQGYEQVLEKPDGWPPRPLWKKVSLKAEK